MRTPALTALALVGILSAPAAAAGTPGPFAGVVAQGQTASHAYDNNPAKQDCIQMMTGYSIRLTYSPPVDRLTLTVDGRSVTGANGIATANVYKSWCTSFGISVTGTQVSGPVASYTVVVTRDTGSGGTLG